MALFKNHRPTFWFLIASAVYRDGLAGVFAFGGVLAAVAFGFSATEVIIFGIALNLVAGVSTIIAGRLDDRFGARAVIVTALSILIVSLPVRLLLPRAGQDDLLDRRHHPLGGRRTRPGVEPVAPRAGDSAGHAGRDLRPLRDDRPRDELPLAAAVGAVHRCWRGATYWGILGITIVLVLGLVLLLLVKLPRHTRL